MKIGYLGQETDLQNQSDCYVVEDISDSLPERSDTPQAPGPDDAMPGRGGERLPGKSVHVKPID